MRAAAFPSKNDPPLVVDPNAVITGKIASQGLQAVARRCGQISNLFRGVNCVEFARCACRNIRWNTAGVPRWGAMIEILCRFVAEG